MTMEIISGKLPEEMVIEGDKIKGKFSPGKFTIRVSDDEETEFSPPIVLKDNQSLHGDWNNNCVIEEKEIFDAERYLDS